LKLDIAGNARLTSFLRLRPHRRTCVRLKLVLNQLLVGSNKIMFLATKKTPLKRGAVLVAGEGLRLDIASNARRAVLINLKVDRRSTARLSLARTNFFVDSNSIIHNG